MNQPTRLSLLSSYGSAIAVFCFTLAYLAFSQGAISQDTVGIELKDGRYVDAIITGIKDKQITWRNPEGGTTSPIPYDKIDIIYFNPLPEWSEAMELFDNSEFEEAADLFKPLSLQLTKRTYYPAPGNFATLAKRRLLDCYRKLSKPTDIAYIQESIDWNKLPASERQLADIVELWAAVGNGKWEEGLQAADKAEKAYRTTAPEVNEIGFLRAIIYKNLEQFEKAVIHFGEGYGLVTSNPLLASASMIESALILNQLVKEDSVREDALKATLHLYAEMIGDGSLWEGAPPELVALHKRPQGTPEYLPPPEGTQ